MKKISNFGFIIEINLKMKKFFSFLLLVTVLLAGSVVAEAKTSKTKSKGKSAASSVLPVIQGETKKYGDYLTTRIFTIKKGKDNEVSVEYPVSGDTRLVNAIRQFIKDNLNEKYTGSLETPESLLRSVMKGISRQESLEEEIQVIYANPTVVTYGIEGYEYAGGAHGMGWRYGKTFLVENGGSLDESMLPSFSTMRSYILKGMANKMNMSESDVIDGFFDSESLDHYGDIMITDEGIDIIYQPYDLGPWSSGIFESVIPISEVYNLMPADAQKFMK